MTEKPTEHLTFAAAQSEAQRIRDFWAARGYWPPEVAVIEIVQPRHLHDHRTAVYGVRTDLVNGLPPRGRKIDAMPPRFRR